MKYYKFTNTLENKSKRSFCYINKTKKLYYIDTSLKQYEVKNFDFVSKDELDNLFIPNKLYLVKSEDETLCLIYSYNIKERKMMEISKQRDIINIIKSQDPIQVSTVRNSEGEGIAPLTVTPLIYSMDGVRNVDNIIKNNIGKEVGKYETAVRYLEIINPSVRIYSIPAPIPNLTIKETTIFLLFVGDQQIESDKYKILDNDYQIEFNEDFELVSGMKIMFIISYHKAIDTETIKISNANLSDELAIEWEASQRHLVDYNNPHRVHKTQVGLGNVQNYPVATNSQATEGESDTTYMTPFKTTQLIKKLIAEGYIEYGSYLIKRTEWNYTYRGSSITTYEIPTDYYDPLTENLSIFMHGLRLELGTDYNITARNVTLLIKIEDGSVLNHIIEKVVPNEVDKTPVFMLKNTHKWTSSEDNQDSFTLPPSIYTTSCRAELYLEGVRMNEGDDYNIDDNIIELNFQVNIGMSIVAYIYETHLPWESIHNRPRAVDNLNSDSTTDYLSARQGKILASMSRNSLNAYRVPGNREVITDNENNVITEIYNNEILLAKEEIIKHEDNSSTTILSFLDETTRNMNSLIIETKVEGNKIIKEYK